MSEVTACEWQFGDGDGEPCAIDASAAQTTSPNAVVVEATHRYASTGTYTVTIEASNAAGAFVESLEILVESVTYLPTVRK